MDILVALALALAVVVVYSSIVAGINHSARKEFNVTSTVTICACAAVENDVPLNLIFYFLIYCNLFYVVFFPFFFQCSPSLPTNLK